MSFIQSDLEDAFVEFVKNRVPMREWQHMTCSYSILNALDEESENEMRTHFWERLVASVRWSHVVDDIDTMRARMVVSDSESEPESEPESVSEF